MAFKTSARLDPYEIVAAIGKGGMGEVWKARDTTLGREVAIKTLPAEFASDADRLARFEREARTLAALNHPHIAQIYGVEKSDTVHALVMELVEGPTLAERIAEGPVPVDDALRIAGQIAEALEAAHEKGIIHRDLKPANVKVRADGTVKVLDFGLAKALDTTGTASAVAHESPTISSPAMTAAGVILGTAAYMSPEQARGKPVDRRADLWAFGCVLYEMLTGRPVWDGETVTDLIAAAMVREPDFSRLPVGMDPQLTRLLRRCLQKDPNKRWRDAGDLRVEIEEVAAESGGFEARTTDNGNRRKAASMIPWVAAFLLGATIAGVGLWAVRPPAGTARVRRFEYVVPEGQINSSIASASMAVSPDGSGFAYRTQDEGIYLRTMDALEARLLVPRPAFQPFFSPDGQWMGFWRLQQLARVPVTGGSPVPLSPAGIFSGISWARDDTILYADAEGIRRVSANDGGTAELIIEAEAPERFDGPQLLPGGDWVLFSITTDGNWDTARIAVHSLETDERRLVWTGGSDARYVDTGHLIYALGDTLYGIGFDLKRLEVTGNPVELEEGLSRASTSASANYGLSNDGTLVYLSGRDTLRTSLVWVDRTGNEQDVEGLPARGYVYPWISPDGSRVALDVRVPEDDILIWDFERENPTRFTPTGESEQDPVWTPGGDGIAYNSARREILLKSTDGSGAIDVMDQSTANFRFPRFFSPTGALVFSDPTSGNGDIGIIFPEGDRDPEWLLATEYSERNAHLSPGGRWMAYESNESGESQIHVHPFPDVGTGHWPVSNNGGIQPPCGPGTGASCIGWSPDRRCA